PARPAPPRALRPHRAPCRATARTVARPTPADAPVTTTTIRLLSRDPVRVALTSQVRVIDAQARERERAECEAEIAQSDVEMRRYGEQVHDDAAQPQPDHPSADSRRDRHQKTGDH